MARSKSRGLSVAGLGHYSEDIGRPWIPSPRVKDLLKNCSFAYANKHGYRRPGRYGHGPFWRTWAEL